ncbi:MAG: hypothetical protein IJ386_01240 [Clostridia bacterium]|nr:hypothetical protein [Clostridia bacterium]
MKKISALLVALVIFASAVFMCGCANEVTETRVDEDGKTYAAVLDDAGKEIRRTYHGLDGRTILRCEFEYDADGNKTKQTRFGEDGSISSVMEYGVGGNETRRTWYNSNGGVVYWHESEYDAGGNEIKRTYYNADGSIVNVKEY